MIGLIAHDVELKRPGCALLQAGMGGTVAFADRFPTETWLLAPTPGLKLYPVEDEAFLARLVAVTE